MPSSPVTAIVPCFNAAPWLRQCLESILRQTRPVTEVLVVDDGSTDGSAAIAVDYPVRLLRLGINRGVAVARNVGLRAASHEIIAWLDADDYWDHHHCETVVPLLQLHPSAALACARARFEQRPERTPWGPSMACPGPRSLLSVSIDRCAVPMCTAVTRRSPCLESGGFREGLAAAVDFDLWLRLAIQHRFIWTSEVTATYRWLLAPTQMSADRARQRRSCWQSRLLVWRELRSSGDIERAADMFTHLQDLWTEELVLLWRRRELGEIRPLLTLPDSSVLECPISARLRRLLAVSAASPPAP